MGEAMHSVAEIDAKLNSHAPPTPAFVQTSIKKITDSYQKVFNVNIDLPESFIQMSIDNDAAEKRICAWLDDIKATFASMISSITEDSKTRSENNGKFEALLEKIVEALKTEKKIPITVLLKPLPTEKLKPILNQTLKSTKN